MKPRTRKIYAALALLCGVGLSAILVYQPEPPTWAILVAASLVGVGLSELLKE